ncbi:hypothetical protein TRIHO_13400 [Tritonibacter horizontis]|uniref:Uncharacterized protein n=1 Tax=Tritonibacter horizontis TaxID=1768241 RepID=A0A132BZR8_9RHOB|nr:hypothetical protein TRIHO_13400 [Tritonibacter horizontis]
MAATGLSCPRPASASRRCGKKKPPVPEQGRFDISQKRAVTGQPVRRSAKLSAMKLGI